MHEKISQSGVIEIGISDHNLIFCTRKIVKNKPGIHKNINFRSFKNYSAEIFEEALNDLDFPNYENFDDIDSAYSDFIMKVTKIIDKVAPIKQSRIKNNSQEWFDSEIAEKIAIRDKLLKKFKKSKLHIDEDMFRESKKEVINTIKRKKKEFIESSLNENIGKPKELWKAIKKLGLPSKFSLVTNTCLKENGKNVFEPKQTANIFKDFFF